MTASAPAPDNGLGGLRYAGGKSGLGPKQTGRWIASNLLTDKHTYCEPFAGMLGILLQRDPADLEVINDADKAVVNWWRTVMHQPDDLARITALTPRSRYEHQRCVDKALAKAEHYAAAEETPPDGGEPGQADSLPESGDLEWAAAWGIAVDRGIGGKPPGRNCYWHISLKRAGRPWLKIPDRLLPLAARLGEVMLECCDALDILERSADNADIMLYVDPPYETAAPGAYVHSVDRAALAAALKRQKGAVAVSGYPADMPELDAAGWRRLELDTTLATLGRIDDKVRPGRVECLWVNYDPPSGQAEQISLL